jgi:hypothetical protein
MELLRTDIGVGVTEYFEHIKAFSLPWTAGGLEYFIANLSEKPAGVSWITWEELFQVIQDGIAIGVYMNIDELIQCDIEDVMAVVMAIVNAVFQRVQTRFGQVFEAEIELANEAAQKIQRAWKKAISNPEYKVCKRRLMFEFNSMQFV